MKTFRGGPCLRRWARAFLFGWLLIVGVGVVNGCALAGQAHGRTMEFASHSARAAAHRHNDDVAAEQARCLDQCAKSSVGAPTQMAADEEAATATAPVLAYAVTQAWIALHRHHDAPSSSAPVTRGTPLLRITLQRLAL